MKVCYNLLIHFIRDQYVDIVFISLDGRALYKPSIELNFQNQTIYKYSAGTFVNT